jgi:hypothetical protein
MQRQAAQLQQPVPAPTEQHKGTWVFMPAGSTAPAPQSGSYQPGWQPRESELPAQPHIPEVTGQRDLAELDSGARNV